MVKQSRACSAVDRHRVNGKAVQTHAKVGKTAVADCQSSDKKGSWRSWFVAPGAYEILRPLPCGRWTRHMSGTDGAKLSSSVAVANVQLHPLPFSRYCGRPANADGGHFDARSHRSDFGRFAGGVQGGQTRQGKCRLEMDSPPRASAMHSTRHHPSLSLESGLRAGESMSGADACSPTNPRTVEGGLTVYWGATAFSFSASFA